MEQIRFGTDGWRATLDEFTSFRVRAIGQAVASFLENEEIAGSVVVGYDARATSRGFAEDLASVLAANGRDVLLPPRDVPTPIVAWSILNRELAGGLVVTASHNPPNYNGVKFIPQTGAPATEEITNAIEDALSEPEGSTNQGSITEDDIIQPYIEHVFELIETDLSGITIAYDAMHGSGRDITDEILERAGAEVIRLRCSKDPDFGGGAPEPSEQNLGELLALSEEVDLGIANDGDADRLAVTTPDGYLDENLVFATLYDYLLEDTIGPAVRTVSTTFLIDRIAQQHDQRVIETPVGFKWVAEGMADHDALIGGEESGGFSIRGHVREKDGVMTALLVATMTSDRPINERVTTLFEQYGEIFQSKTSIACPEPKKAPVLRSVQETIPSLIAGRQVDHVNELDGVKILLTDGSWVLLRPSGTEPKIRIYAESSSSEQVEALLEEGREIVEPLLDA